MQEPIRIDVPQVNGHVHHRGVPLLSPDPPSAGFTAVNGLKPKSTAFRLVDTAMSPHHTSDNDSVHRPASGLAQYHAHGWRPADSDPPQGSHDLQQRQSPNTGKRKRSDIQDIDDARSTGPNGDRSDSIKRSSMTLDSAVDLTSPENPTESHALDATDSDSWEQAGTYERQKTPVERWNQGDPPPKPRPETEASLAASLHQFQRQNQQAQGTYQARSVTPHAHDISPPNEYDDIGEPHGLSDDQYNADGSDPKRRKRNFSNRTKTGCHTCRQRKKKCDEGKPTCQNCERSGHPCKGYGPKPPGEDKSASQGRSVVPLQSKTPMAPYSNRNGDTSTRGEEGRSYSHWGRMPPQIPPPPPEPEHRAFIPVAPADPRRPNTADHWQKPAFPPQEPPPTYQNERLPPPPNFSQMPPPQQPYHPSQHPPPVTPQLQYPPPPPVQHHPPPPQPLPPRQSAPPHPIHAPPEPWGHQQAPPPYSTPNGVGPPSMGSSRDSAQSGPNRSGPFGMDYGGGNRQIEKDKMLRGQPFLYYLDQFLLEERLNCKAAVERYNKAAEMTSGISRSERGKLFTQILKPFKRPHTEAPQTPHRGPVGSVGDHTIIETPFKCEFGYNIHIGKDCIIESGAYFQDAADIGIGSRVTIGHNVKLYTIAANIDVNARRGNLSQVIAGAIAVQDDSFLGADVIVLPFVTIGKGAVVGAGSVVTKDVEPYTIVAGNPAKLIRRIEGSNMGRHHSQQIQRQQEEMQRSMVEYANSGFSTTSPQLG